MQKNEGNEWRRRVMAATVIGAALASGLLAAAGPATAAQPATPNHGTNALPKVGAAKTPFSPRTAPSATTAKGVTAADAADHPWVVGILVNNGIGTAQTCTGTIISPTKVLTSARCDTKVSDSHVVVVAGRDNLFDPSAGYVDAVSSTWTNPLFSYTPNGRPDDGTSMGENVEVLTLSTALPSVYTPIGLSGQGDESPYTVGSSATTYGYTWTNNQNGSNYPYLVQAPVTLQAGSACTAVNANYPANQEVCAGFTDGAQHDSNTFNLGSPLVASNGKQIGVADRLTQAANTQAAFERLSIVHDAVTADLSRSVLNNLDWYGDGNSDLLGTDVDGHMIDFQGLGANPATNPGFSKQAPIDQYDWYNNYYQMIRVNNFDGHGTSGLLAVGFYGSLNFFPNNGSGGVDENVYASVGNGWNQFDTIVPINNFTGDGNLALLAKKPDGSLWLYEHGADGWVNGNGVEIGGGFQQFSSLTAFQWTNNGPVGLLGVTTDGLLKFYGVDGSGHWTNGAGQVIGSGFGDLYTVLSTGSFGGSDTGSIMAVSQSGILKVYQANGTGGWLTGNGVQIGAGFDRMGYLF